MEEGPSVSKFIIVSSVWASNYQLQRNLNGPKKARNVNPRVQKTMKTSPNVFYKEYVHIRDVAKKLSRVLKIVCYNPRKWPETDVFTKTQQKTFLAWRHTPSAVIH
jgi:hypothetical protein